MSGRENRVRIIGGRWRGRKLAFPDGDGLRPTGDRIRETLFNWLMPVLPGARCLDLFAGSGVLGFEALSRGAASCVLVERNPEACRLLRESVRLLDAPSATVVGADCLSWLPTAQGPLDVVFLDPPFAELRFSPTDIVQDLDARGVLSSDPWIYVEQPADTPPIPPAGFGTHRQQCAGKVCFSLWRRQENIL